MREKISFEKSGCDDSCRISWIRNWAGARMCKHRLSICLKCGHPCPSAIEILNTSDEEECGEADDITANSSDDEDSRDGSAR